MTYYYVYVYTDHHDYSTLMIYIDVTHTMYMYIFCDRYTDDSHHHGSHVVHITFSIQRVWHIAQRHFQGYMAHPMADLRGSRKIEALSNT